MKKKKWNYIVLLSLTFLALTGCSKDKANTEFLCHVGIEDGEGFCVEQPVKEVKPKEDVSFLVKLKQGYILDSADYSKTTITKTKDVSVQKVTFHDMKYSTMITLDVKKSTKSIFYDANGGTLIKNSSTAIVKEPIILTHLRQNTSIGTDYFCRDGYTLIGWNTKADGSGTQIGLGSRVDFTNHMTLYAMWSKWSDASEFTYEVVSNQIVLTGYKGKDTILSIPGEIEYKKVVAISANTFENATAEVVILPNTMKNVEAEAFLHANLRELYLYDSLTNLSDYSFDGCNNLRTLHINAVERPVYSGSYYDTFEDKYDRLLSLKNTKKIVLFSGSSSRFGYDSKAIKQAFPSYEVENMGVFAYTNATPQLLLILQQMNKGDILIDSPEFDAAKRQFCTSYDFDDAFFAMIESNYDILTNLDLREFHKVFGSFATFLKNRQGMETKSYDISAADFDEAGNPSQVRTYNDYGDYIVSRPNAKTTTPIYNLQVEYTVSAFPKDYYIDSLNAMYEKFLNQQIKVYFTYAPRNQLAIAKDATWIERQKLDAYLKQELNVPVISNLEDSLMSGIYFYGTDNHLSSEGVEIRTQNVIADLKEQMEQGE